MLLSLQRTLWGISSWNINELKLLAPLAAHKLLHMPTMSYNGFPLATTPLFESIKINLQQITEPYTYFKWCGVFPIPCSFSFWQTKTGIWKQGHPNHKVQQFSFTQHHRPVWGKLFNQRLEQKAVFALSWYFACQSRMYFKTNPDPKWSTYIVIFPVTFFLLEDI